MKKLLLLFIPLMFFFSCSNKNSFVGSWDVFEDGYKTEWVITFSTNNTLDIKSARDPIIGTWEVVNESLLCLQWEEDQDIVLNCGEYNWLNENMLILDLEESLRSTFTLKRKN